jgi:hypothetical protein
MCRNIKKLRQPDRHPTEAELHDASLQFIRKISGFRAPSKANEAAFDRAVREVAMAGSKLFASLQSHHGVHKHAGHQSESVHA